MVVATGLCADQYVAGPTDYPKKRGYEVHDRIYEKPCLALVQNCSIRTEQLHS